MINKSQFSEVRWGKVLMTSIGTYALSFVSLILIITAYAFVLAFKTRGAPDQEMIQKFATQVTPWIGPLLTLLLTFGAAVRVSRKVEKAKNLHGLLIGIFVSLISIVISLTFGWRGELLDLMWFLLIIAAGWFGGNIGCHKITK